MHDTGIRGLSDPSGLFLSRRPVPVPGTCVTVTLEGRRPLVAEVQALVTQSSAPTPRRASSGLDTNRVAMILAVLQQRGGIGGLASSRSTARPSAACGSPSRPRTWRCCWPWPRPR